MSCILPHALPSVNNIVDARCRFCHTASMTKKDVLGIRLEPDEKAALEKAAAKDDRSLSAMARKLIVDALRKAGHLKAPRK